MEPNLEDRNGFSHLRVKEQSQLKKTCVLTEAIRLIETLLCYEIKQEYLIVLAAFRRKEEG